MKHVGAYDNDPQFFRYRNLSNIFLLLKVILLALTAASIFYAGYCIMNYKPASELGVALISSGVGIALLVGLNAWNIGNRADKEEMFTVWAIEHHGLVPLNYHLGSEGVQQFTSVETGDIVTKEVVKDRNEFKNPHIKSPCLRVSIT